MLWIGTHNFFPQQHHFCMNVGSKSEQCVFKRFGFTDFKTSLFFIDKHINYVDGHLCTWWRRRKVIIIGENWPIVTKEEKEIHHTLWWYIYHFSSEKKPFLLQQDIKTGWRSCSSWKRIVKVRKRKTHYKCLRVQSPELAMTHINHLCPLCAAYRCLLLLLMIVMMTMMMMRGQPCV